MASFTNAMYRFFRWLDNNLQRFWLFYPDQFYGRLGRYVKSAEDIRKIRWARLRYEPDNVKIDLHRPVDEQRIKEIVQDISRLMDDGWIHLTFYQDRDVVAEYRMMNGKEHIQSA